MNSQEIIKGDECLLLLFPFHRAAEGTTVIVDYILPPGEIDPRTNRRMNEPIYVISGGGLPTKPLDKWGVVRNQLMKLGTDDVQDEDDEEVLEHESSEV